jgi:hypothetical protein
MYGFSTGLKMAFAAAVAKVIAALKGASRRIAGRRAPDYYRLGTARSSCLGPRANFCKPVRASDITPLE